jgi:S-adenosyl methyltransferase
MTINEPATSDATSDAGAADKSETPATEARRSAAEATGTGGIETLPFDTSVANQARLYDYLLGGKDNYAVDRAAADAFLKVNPDTVFTVRENRAFLGRAVRFLAADAGIRQFLDIGTGIPTAGNTHHVAQSIAADARVVYVDYDPIVLAHARALLTTGGAGKTAYIHADLRDTGKVLDKARELLDFTQPVAITLIAILHAIPDTDDPHAIVARLMDAVPSGSYLTVSHLGSDLVPPESLKKMKDIETTSATQQQYTYRTSAEVTRFFEGMDLVPPGLVPLEKWRPDPGAVATGKSFIWAATGRKP